MSSPIWTPDELRSDARRYEGRGWRLVEAQHQISTLKLVDSLEEQDLLEQVLETSKPLLPAECRSLDYLLSTPFRYRPYPSGSRFRRAGLTPGVWYGAEAVETAVAEMAFYRCLFYAESPDTPFPDDAAEYMAFSAQLRTDAAIDLTRPPFDRNSPHWSHPTDYGACQTMADIARISGADLIRYRSVRDPAGGAALAVLTCAAFASPAPVERRTWRLRISDAGVQALQEFPIGRLSFPTSAFQADSRLEGMVWGRARPR